MFLLLFLISSLLVGLEEKKASLCSHSVLPSIEAEIDAQRGGRVTLPLPTHKRGGQEIQSSLCFHSVLPSIEAGIDDQRGSGVTLPFLIHKRGGQEVQSSLSFHSVLPSIKAGDQMARLSRIPFPETGEDNTVLSADLQNVENQVIWKEKCDIFYRKCGRDADLIAKQRKYL
ncbi:MAG: hypothetical protein OXC30_02600 [Alphaproteobacteria bacterium]|nr:hypothetical protein [Alphaproteobacteria bacterium]